MATPDTAVDRRAVSPNTAAHLLDLGRSTLYAHMAAGNIKFIPVGADRRIPMTEIDRVLAEGLPRLNAKKSGRA